MPIEFECRYCQALIRVPDNAAGGKGRCPKCATRITVPRKSTAKPIRPPEPEEEPFVLPLAEESAEPIEFMGAPTADILEPQRTLFDPTEVSQSRLGELPIVTASSVTKTSLNRKTQTRRGPNPWIIGAIVVGVSALAAGFVWLPNLNAVNLTGELTASSATTLELPPVVIDKSRINVDAAELVILLKKLELSPVPMASNNMHIQLGGSTKGLVITVEAGAQTQFYRVNLRANDAVGKFIEQRWQDLEEDRWKGVARAATEFVTKYQSVLAKTSPPESLSSFRDGLALPALAGSLGNQLVAASGRSLYRCAYEDREGNVYFLLPPGVKEFEILGRAEANGKAIVPAQFKVIVKDEIAPAAKTNTVIDAEKVESLR